MTLFDPQPGGVHHDDPDTSVEAAHDPRNMVRWGTQRYDLLLVFQGRSAGLTADRAGELAGVGDYNQRRRCSELIAGGYLEPTGTTLDGMRVLAITAKGATALRSAASQAEQAHLDYHNQVMRPSE